MPQYMFVLGGVTEEKRKAVESKYEEINRKYAEWSERLFKGGHLKDAHKLRAMTGRRLVLKDGKILDGPFAETKESIGGYYLIEAKNIEEAVELSKQCPTMLYQGGYVEVREVEM